MSREALLGLLVLLTASLPSCNAAEPTTRDAAPATRPPETPKPFDEAAWTRQMAAACNKVVATEKAKRPADFTVAAEPPFVVVSNLSATQTAYFRRHTIAAAQKALWATYFQKRPTAVTYIYLFKDAATYRRYAAEWFGDREVPHFGYFRRADRVMVMNIATGGGTLVHEMVHALIAPDFPDVPDWFNEGLASLYEQCSIRGDRITGHVNWRLPGLQRAIAAKTLRPLRELMTADDFYRHQTGLNYAQARYLCQYLQHTGKLVAYYRTFRDTHKTDQWGVTSLEKVTGQTLTDLEKAYLKWVTALRR